MSKLQSECLWKSQTPTLTGCMKDFNNNCDDLRLTNHPTHVHSPRTTVLSREIKFTRTEDETGTCEGVTTAWLLGVEPGVEGSRPAWEEATRGVWFEPNGVELPPATDGREGQRSRITPRGSSRTLAWERLRGSAVAPGRGTIPSTNRAASSKECVERMPIIFLHLSPS